MVILAGSGKLC
ncbi:hypothetical protein Zm00014a_019653 [Zea mays]|uniref:Uncharacterized protein n=1 Tax=Zea mays TaxID=4577 RepID=A0A3L6DK14_MAIZE|nr:hypothetical protein Zm00014a_019653 [Zea mays]